MRKLLSLLVITLCFAALLTTTTPTQAAKHSVAVLMYHYVSDPPAGSDQNRITLSVSVTNFRQQMKWLKDNGYHSITPDDLFSTKDLPSKPVLLTFDDGHVDNYLNAFPILQEYGLKGTFFIITDWVDKGQEGVLTWDQIRAMKAAGMTIEPHTRTHQTLAGHPYQWQKDEIVGSIEAIKKQLGSDPRYFAYPYGSYDKTTLKILGEAKIIGAFTTHDGAVNSVVGRGYVLPRLRITFRMTITDFASLILRTVS
jgi:peptidoglycan/xylan/chitin deacetylase (PgdA/CDA1 family)